MLILGAAVGVVAVLIAVLIASRSSSPESPDPVAVEPVGTWSAAPSLTAIRGTASAVVLDDGSVLVAGGGVGALTSAATEILAPGGDAWEEVGPLSQARRGHQAVLLDDGRVLVSGGLSDGAPLASAEIYDPSTRAWSPVAPMISPRLGHSLTLLKDGKVLAAGGSTLEAAESAGGGQTIRSAASAELFDPASGTWTATGSMGTARFEHTATRLGDGRVVMAGGLGPVDEAGKVGPLASTEIYDPAASAFVGSTDLSVPRANHAAVLLGDDSVLVTGGSGGDAGDISLASAEVFDVRAGSWNTVAPMGGTRTGHAAVRLEDGRVLVVGGESVQRGTRRSLTSAELFDFDSGASGAWSPAGDMSCPRSEQAAVLLHDGRVLVIAGDAAFPGQAPIAQSCTETYQP
ncbi:MAG: Kelch repeat-containing protein [Marmoricola sp.]